MPAQILFFKPLKRTHPPDPPNPTVKSTHGKCCPHCGSDEKLHVYVVREAWLEPGDYDMDEIDEFSICRPSQMRCDNCHHCDHEENFNVELFRYSQVWETPEVPYVRNFRRQDPELNRAYIAARSSATRSISKPISNMNRESPMSVTVPMSRDGFGYQKRICFRLISGE